jgi:hypothetical protein
MTQTLEGIISFFKENKKRALPLILLISGILLLLISIPESDSSQKDSTMTLCEYKARLEDELSSLCSAISGVGKCKVSVSFAEGARLEYKGSVEIGSTPPRVLGITVICDGGRDPAVCESISRMMCALFDVGANRVAVLPKK